MQQTVSSQQSNKPIWYFLLFWTALNLLQARTLELHGDEAYYWVYSRFLDWGYFDHPPMVALFIKLGNSLMHNELGLRLLTVITSSASMYLLWLILKKYNAQAKWFMVVVSGLFIFHIYGFTTTPDSPLLFFAVLFYYFYQRYIDNDNWGLALILALVTACLLYSKYHGILLIGFTVLANPKLFKRKTFWLIAAGALALYLPHILWQVGHGFPSVKYHLFDRSASVYHSDFTTLYPLGQIAMAGPLIGWFLFYSAFKTKASDVFTRTLKFNFIGTFLFFFVSTLKGEVQPHWTLIAFVPLLMLVMIRFTQMVNPPKWFYRLAIANIVLILFIRSALLFQYPFVMNMGQLKSYFGFRDWTQRVQQKAGDSYVVIRDGFQDPSKYNYYSNSTRCTSYDSRYYRKTQYDIWPIEDSLQHKRVYYLQDGPEKGLTTDSVVDEYGRKYYSGWVDDWRSYQKTDIAALPAKATAQPGQTVTFKLTLHNPYAYAISFADSGYLHKAFLEACFFQGNDQKWVTTAGAAFKAISIKPGGTSAYTFPVRAPMEKGKYELFFSIRTQPLAGSRNSGVIAFEVE